MKRFLPPSLVSKRLHHRGAALVIVLAFVVLLTGLVVAYFSRSINDRQLSNSSYNGTNADAFARSAVDLIVADLKQEIVNGSNPAYPSPSPASGTIYYPSSNANMIPTTSGTPASGVVIPNLIRRSVRDNGPSGVNPMPLPGVPSRASTVNSQSDASINGRSISLARWNKHYLIPKANTSDDKSDPVSSFVAPDWVAVTAEKGPAILSIPFKDSGGTDVTPIGRYAYAIYDEGGLLDANVAGYPNGTTPGQSGYKSSLAYADLTTLPYPLPNSSPYQVDKLVGWRNYATTQPSNAFPGSTFAANFRTDPNPALNYFNYLLSNSSGFLTTGLNIWNNRTDQRFLSRQQLIAYQGSSGFSVNALQYLATFSRDLNQPSYVRLQSTDSTKTLDYKSNVPRVLAANQGGNNAVGLDDKINPSFLSIRVSEPFARNDSSPAVKGEPLVKKRFNLNRLAWLTYKGPSADRTLPPQSPALSRTDPDYDMWALQWLHGVPRSLLQQGTALNIQKYFGLNWSVGYVERAGPIVDAWFYNVHNGNAGTGPTGAILKLGDNAALGISAHEPDFFELLKAGINVGSIAKSAVQSASSAISPNTALVPTAFLPANYQFKVDSSVDYQMVQIGANIISQAKVDGYPAQIVFDDGTGARLFAGVENFPYLNYIFQGVLASTSKPPTPDPAAGTTDPPPQDTTLPGNTVTAPGLAALLQIPALWNPHDVASDGSTPITPTVPGLRPANFRLVVDSTYPDNIDPTGAGTSYFSYYPLAYPNKTGITASARDWSQRDPSTPPSTVSSLNQPPPQAPQPKSLSWRSTALQFRDNNGTLFREPTILFRAGATGNPMNLTNAESGAPMQTWSLQTDFGAPTLVNPDSNPLGIPASEGGPLDPANSQFLGIYLGPVPLRFHIKDNSAKVWAVTTNSVGYFLPGGSIYGGVYFTYRLQYQDPGGQWVTYSTQYGGPTINDIPNFHYKQNKTTAVFGLGDTSRNGYSSTSWGTVIDPRTSRFGFFNGNKVRDDTNGASGLHPGVAIGLPQTHGWIDPVNGTINTLRPDRNAGHYFYGNSTGGDFPTRFDSTTPLVSAGWIIPNRSFFGTNYEVFAPGLLTQNNSDITFAYGRWSPEMAPNPGTEYGDRNAPIFYADPDGVVRRAMSAYVPLTQTSPIRYDSDLTIGLPMARAQAYVNGNPPSSPPSTNNSDPTATSYISQSPIWRINQAQSRPLFLNRPFRSVAELGYVFSGTPWKNLDFSTPESGSAALLDIFCVQDSDDANALVAGKVNLNTRQSAVLASIIAGSYVDDPKISDATIGSLTPTAATTIAQALVARTTSATYGPFSNVSQMVGRWVAPVPPNAALLTSYNPPITLPSTTLDGKASYSGFSGIFISGGTTASSPAQDLSSAYMTAFSTNTPLLQSLSNVQRLREAPIRSLSSTTQTRTWNLMIDVVAQTGRYSANASGLAQFLVEGEQRYWVHVAIDRFTGNILDRQIEIVKE